MHKKPLHSHHDPYRDSGHAAEFSPKPTTKVESFKLHISHEKTAKKATTEAPKVKRSSLKTTIQDFTHQIIATAVIMVVGFIAMNFSALYELGKFHVNGFFQGEEVSVLDKLIETPKVTLPKINTASVVEESSSIPALDLEVAPADTRIIIPRIDQNIPIIRVSSEALIKKDWQKLESDIQDALKDGVVHYPGTSMPGQSGNVVVTGHSSYFPWDPGRFKDVFVLLHEVSEGDDIIVYHNQKKYHYKVDTAKVVMPEEIEVLRQTPDDQLTLITCTPIGTNLKRLIVTAKPV